MQYFNIQPTIHSYSQFPASGQVPAAGGLPGCGRALGEAWAARQAGLFPPEPKSPVPEFKKPSPDI